MKVKMKTLAAGPKSVWRPGQVVNVDAEVARVLIEGGYAERVEKAESLPQEAAQGDFTQIPYISAEIAAVLRGAGYETFEDLAEASDEELLALPSLAKGRLKAIREFLENRE